MGLDQSIPQPRISKALDASLAEETALHLKRLGRQITTLRQNAAIAEIGMEQAEKTGHLLAYAAARRIRDAAAVELERLEVAEAAARAALPPIEPVQHCEHCHTTGDVRMERRYVGGHGYQAFYQCRDSRACWARYDARNLRRRFS